MEILGFLKFKFYLLFYFTYQDKNQAAKEEHSARHHFWSPTAAVFKRKASAAAVANGCQTLSEKNRAATATHHDTN